MLQYTKKLENKPISLFQRVNPKRIRKKILDSIKNTNKNSPKIVIPSTGGAGFVPSRWNESKTFGNPNAGSIKDIAYRIMSLSSELDRGIMDIIRGVAESVTSVPIPEDRYTGSFSLEDNKSNTSKINKDLNDRDLNWLVMYGNTKNQFEPTTIPKTGFNYSDYLKKYYGRSTMPTYKGNIITADQIPIPNEYRPLVNFLSDNPNYGYYAAENEEDPEGWLGMIESEKTQLNAVDDVNSYRKSFRKNPKTGKPELAALDLIDYGGGDYDRKWGRLAGIQGGLLSRVINSPVLLDLSIPVKYTEDPKDYFGPGWYYTLKGIVDNNKILEKLNGLYSYPLALPEVEISPNKNKKERTYTPRVSTIRKKTKRKYLIGGYVDYPANTAIHNVGAGIRRNVMKEIRRRLYDNLYPMNYSGDFGSVEDRLFTTLIKNKPESVLQNEGYFKERDDIFAEYLQIPKEERHKIEGKAIVEDAKYKPSKSKDENVKYKRINPLFITTVYDTKGEYKVPLHEALVSYDIPFMAQYDFLPKLGKNVVTNDSYSKFFGGYTLGTGYDKKGHYYSIYDKWDLDPGYDSRTKDKYQKSNGEDKSMGIGKPIEFYDRVYLDDYYGLSKPSHSLWLPEVKVYGKKK